MTFLEHVAYALLWLSFGVLHSALADRRLKEPVQHVIGSRYRVAYNIVATVHVGAVYFIGRFLLASDSLDFSLPQYWPTVSTALQVLGFAIIIVALSHYDLGRFVGITQIQRQEPDVDGEAAAEQLHISGLHRWVRHPLYLGVFLVLWSRVAGEFELATAVWASLYVVIGAKLEEGRLIGIYGDAYTIYRQKVPMFFPVKRFR
ncbi:MAG: isoprenylcysteine carboxylmethyltransferase family protein [Pseudomonadota bacterium]